MAFSQPLVEAIIETPESEPETEDDEMTLHPQIEKLLNMLEDSDKVEIISKDQLQAMIKAGVEEALSQYFAKSEDTQPKSTMLRRPQIQTQRQLQQLQRKQKKTMMMTERKFESAESQLQELLAQGEITPEQAKHYKNNVLTRAIGADANLKFDYKVLQRH